MKSFSSALPFIYACIALGQEPHFQETLRAKADPALPVYTPVEGLAGELTSVGTDTMDDLMKSWVGGFSRYYPKIAITIESKGSLTAEPALTEGRAQLAPLSRELMPDELERFRTRHGYDPFVVKVALGSYRTPTKTVALTFYVNEKNPISKLTLQQLDAIYCSTRHRGAPEDILTWGQLGATGDWANRRIAPVGVMVPDGISNYIRLAVCQNGKLKTGIREEKIDHSDGAISVLDRIVSDVSKDPSAIGYAGFHNAKPGAKQVALAEADSGPFLKGTFEEVSSARYPLTRYIYICVDRSPGKTLDPKITEFLRYVLSREGQQAVENEGVFMPLPASSAIQEQTRLQPQLPPLRLLAKIPAPGMTGTWDHLAADPEGKRIFVSAQEDHVVWAFDLVGNKAAGAIRADFNRPQGLFYVPSGYLIVSNGRDGTLKIVDGRRSKLVKTIPLSLGADMMDYDPRTRYIYVDHGGKDSNRGPGALGVIDTAKMEMVGDIVTDWRPGAVELEKTGPRLFVTLPGASQIGVIDRNSRTFLTRFSIAAHAKPVALALDEAHARVFVGTRTPDKFIVLDMDSGETIAALDSVGGISGMFFDAAHQRIYVSGLDGIIEVYRQSDPHHYESMGRMEIVPKAGTSLFVPSLNRYCVAAPPEGDRPGEIWIFEPLP